MVIEVYWTDFAKTELRKIKNYYQEEVNATFAETFVQKIIEKANSLKDFQFIGQSELGLPDIQEDVRYLLAPPFKILYYFNQKYNRIDILDIFHTRQHPKTMLKKRDKK